MKLIRIFFIIIVGLALQNCNQSSGPLDKHISSFDPNIKSIDSILAFNTFKSKSIMISDTSLLIKMYMPDEEAKYFRRRGYIVDFSIYSIRSLINNINHIKVKEYVENERRTESNLIDSITYNKLKLSVIKEWNNNDPLSFKLMLEMLKLNKQKYDELSSIALFIADSLSNGEFKKDFYPDFTFFLDNYINEMYGDINGTDYRKYMEYFYYYAHDITSLKYLSPQDVKPFLDYGDLNYYLKNYPKEIEEIKRMRNKIPKEWSPVVKTI